MGWIRRVSPQSSHGRYLQEISPRLRAVQPASVCRPVHRDNHQRSTDGTHVREWTVPAPACAAPTFSTGGNFGGTHLTKGKHANKWNGHPIRDQDRLRQGVLPS